MRLCINWKRFQIIGVHLHLFAHFLINPIFAFKFTRLRNLLLLSYISSLFGAQSSSTFLLWVILIQPRRARCTKRWCEPLKIHVSGTHDAGVVHNMFENLLVANSSLASHASLSVLCCLVVSLSKVIWVAYVNVFELCISLVQTYGWSVHIIFNLFRL